MKTYATVEDFCNQNIPIEYHYYYMGYGCGSRTDVEAWIDEVFTDPEAVKKRAGMK